MSDATRVNVPGERPYDVVVGHDLAGELTALLPARTQRVLLVHASEPRAAVDAVTATLHGAGLRVLDAPVPDGEAAKDAGTAAELWSALGRAGFTRTDAVVTVGGGAVTDLAGFVAATWLRGVTVVHVATTLLAMVDAAIGGKTAINTAEGKNLVGAFHPPAGVLCDLDLLRSLPRPELVSGLAEVVKAGFIADPRILELVEADPRAAAHADGAHLRELVERSVRVKAAVVGADLREAAGREVLNYGHTLGHAIERVERYRWRHGEAVAVGMVFAAELSRLAGRLDDAAVARHRAVLQAVGLPVGYRADRWGELLVAMQVDKKARGSTLRFVVLDAIARPDTLEGPDDDLLAAAFARVSR